MNIVFMGTPDFAVPSLKALVNAGENVTAVFTQPDKPKGRGYKMIPTPVKEAAAEAVEEVKEAAEPAEPEAEKPAEEKAEDKE